MTGTSNKRLSSSPSDIFALAAAAAVLAGLFAYFPYASGYGDRRVNVFEFMAYVWKNPEWEHCWLVPLAAIGIVIYKRKSLGALPVEGSWLGLAALVASFGLYWIGYLADNVYVGYASLLAMVASCVLWLLGREWLKALAFPIAFLIFMFPLPAMDEWAVELRKVMSALSAGFLNLVGLPVVQNGTSLVSAPDFAAGLPAGARFAVEVANPCSGIRSLFALMMVSALYGYLTMRRPWQKWAIFLSSLPLAIAGNFARIIMLTVGTVALGANVAIGTEHEPTFFHMAAGFLVFGVALGGMVLLGNLLQRFGGKDKEGAE